MINTVQLKKFENNNLPENIGNLIIADPPYYKVKGEFDFVWKTFDEYLKPRNPFSIYLREEFSRANVTAKEISKLFPSKTGGLTGCVSNWLNGNNVITAIQYGKIRDYLGGDYLSREYFELLKIYSEIQEKVERTRRPFNNAFQLQEILNFSNEANQTGSKYDHDTVKPETLTRALILTFSNEGDTVIVPFAGSGTECAMATREKRPFYSFEISDKFKNMAQDRANNELSKPKLF